MEDYRILEIPEYLELLLAVANGYNYASKIAAYFSKEGEIIGHGKKQPTITEQLHTLKKYGLVKEKGYSKSKIYEINWDKTVRAFYRIINIALDDIVYAWSEKDSKALKKIGVQNIVPTELIKDFFISHVDSLTVGGTAVKHKGISELTLGFFAAIIQLEDKYVNKLVKRYSINKAGLLKIADFINYYSYLPELLTLEDISMDMTV